MDNTSTILEELRFIRSDLSDLKGSFSTLRSVVMGNGSKGHEQRIESIEDWRHSHPAQCPIDIKKGDIYKRRGLEIAIMGIILGIIQVIISYFAMR